MSEKERTEVKDLDQSIYNFSYEEKDEDFFKVRKGLDESIIERISKEKNDPAWMKEWRLKCLKIFNETNEPDWGPDIHDLDIQAQTQPFLVIIFIIDRFIKRCRCLRIPKNFQRARISTHDHTILAEILT